MSNSTHSSPFLEFSMYNLRYSVNRWWDLSIELLLCRWYADIVYCLMRNLFATFFISEDVKFASWSARMAIGDPNRQINRFTKTFVISAEEIPSIGIPIEYFVNKSWIINIYSFPFCVEVMGVIGLEESLVLLTIIIYLLKSVVYTSAPKARYRCRLEITSSRFG